MLPPPLELRVWWEQMSNYKHGENSVKPWGELDRELHFLPGMLCKGRNEPLPSTTFLLATWTSIQWSTGKLFLMNRRWSKPLIWCWPFGNFQDWGFAMSELKRQMIFLNLAKNDSPFMFSLIAFATCWTQLRSPRKGIWPLYCHVVGLPSLETWIRWLYAFIWDQKNRLCSQEVYNAVLGATKLHLFWISLSPLSILCGPRKVPLLLWIEATLVRYPSNLCMWSEVKLYLHSAQGTWDSMEEEDEVRTNGSKFGNQTGRTHATPRRLGRSWHRDLCHLRLYRHELGPYLIFHTSPWDKPSGLFTVPPHSLPSFLMPLDQMEPHESLGTALPLLWYEYTGCTQEWGFSLET